MQINYELLVARNLKLDTNFCIKYKTSRFDTDQKYNSELRI